MHPLKAWLEKTGATEAEFARLVRPKKPNGRRRKAPKASYISQLITGYRFPSRPMAFAIEEATSGAVTAAEMLIFEAPVSADEQAA